MSIAAFSNARVSTPGTHGQFFVNGNGNRNDRPWKRVRKDPNISSGDEELSRQDAEDRVIINALPHQNVCSFNAGGSPFPLVNINTPIKFRFSHDEAGVADNHYPGIAPVDIAGGREPPFGVANGRWKSRPSKHLWNVETLQGADFPTASGCFRPRLMSQTMLRKSAVWIDLHSVDFP